MRPLIIVSDLHLGHRPCDDVAADLARLMQAHPSHELVLNGDTFNQGCDPPGLDPIVSAIRTLEAHPPVLSTLAARLRAGAPVTMIAGNHDPALIGIAARRAFLGALAVADDAPLTLVPWILRRGDLHIEHGHLYDPSNSPTHPLAVPTPRTEPIGMKLTRRFIGRYDLWEMFADAWSASPPERIRLMTARFGTRDAVVKSLFYTGLLVLVNIETLYGGRLLQDLRAGEAAMAADAAIATVPLSQLRALVEGRPAPLHFSFWRTFIRFGFDALLALMTIPAGIAASLLMRHWWPLGVAAAGLAYLIVLRNQLRERGENHMPAELRAGAALVRRMTGARLVILGHTHREDDADGYVNLGAFGDRPAPLRTYLHVDEDGRVERRTLPAL